MEPVLEQLTAYLKALPPQRLILRGVDEVRPYNEESGVTVGRVTYVEVVTASARERVARRFDGVSAVVARAVAEGIGHTVLERSGNIT